MSFLVPAESGCMAEGLFTGCTSVGELVWKRNRFSSWFWLVLLCSRKLEVYKLAGKVYIKTLVALRVIIIIIFYSFRISLIWLCLVWICAAVCLFSGWLSCLFWSLFWGWSFLLLLWVDRARIDNIYGCRRFSVRYTLYKYKKSLLSTIHIVLLSYTPSQWCNNIQYTVFPR